MYAPRVIAGTHKIDVTEIETAIGKLKLNKTDASFELYSNDCIYACKTARTRWMIAIIIGQRAE